MRMGERRRVLVTGAARGIGRAIAGAFHRGGARVALLDIRQDDLAVARSALGGDTIARVADVRDPESVRRAVADAAERMRGLDVAVANAGVYPSQRLLHMPVAAWDDVMAINARGAFLTCQAAAQAMVARGNGGAIVTIASGSARFGREGAGHYCASKAAVVMLTRVLALELARYRIRVNAVSPGLVDVPGGPSLSGAYKAAMTRAVPAGRMGRPEDVAAAVVALCDPGLDYVTGQVLPVDGGLSAGRYGIPTQANEGDHDA